MLTRKVPLKSPSNTYVAICYRSKFDGVYFKKFEMPELGNVSPSWYFLTYIDIVACIEDVISWEDYQDLRLPVQSEESKAAFEAVVEKKQ